jgi:hypothetical protein
MHRLIVFQPRNINAFTFEDSSMFRRDPIVAHRSYDCSLIWSEQSRRGHGGVARFAAWHVSYSTNDYLFASTGKPVNEHGGVPVYGTENDRGDHIDVSG